MRNNNLTIHRRDALKTIPPLSIVSILQQCIVLLRYRIVILGQQFAQFEIARIEEWFRLAEAGHVRV